MQDETKEDAKKKQKVIREINTILQQCIYIFSSLLPSAAPLSSPQEQINVCFVAFLIYISLLWTPAGTSKTKEDLVKPLKCPQWCGAG